ncbi:MAG: hypothetical protein Ct9H300mP3_10390 [Gammaproteobacteria bacterium]|nr:MAG: hypothetical protein Ct9H300mP3_10390 [Gammaproteobacteria bacterium]
MCSPDNNFRLLTAFFAFLVYLIPYFYKHTFGQPQENIYLGQIYLPFFAFAKASFMGFSSKGNLYKFL